MLRLFATLLVASLAAWPAIASADDVCISCEPAEPQRPSASVTISRALRTEVTIVLDLAPAGSASQGAGSETSSYVHDYFATAQFFALSDAVKLSRPAFEQMKAGCKIDPETRECEDEEEGAD